MYSRKQWQQRNLEVHEQSSKVLSANIIYPSLCILSTILPTDTTVRIAKHQDSLFYTSSRTSNIYPNIIYPSANLICCAEQLIQQCFSAKMFKQQFKNNLILFVLYGNCLFYCSICMTAYARIPPPSPNPTSPLNSSKT